mmetsp:Transcript_66586/g.171356  ORF Transcript_66586/g.171356 Transcript_66586/m.171356 type:complete len:283 (+) Transcript_66586:317-1165(+)
MTLALGPVLRLPVRDRGLHVVVSDELARKTLLGAHHVLLLAIAVLPLLDRGRRRRGAWRRAWRGHGQGLWGRRRRHGLIGGVLVGVLVGIKRLHVRLFVHRLLIHLSREEGVARCLHCHPHVLASLAARRHHEIRALVAGGAVPRGRSLAAPHAQLRPEDLHALLQLDLLQGLGNRVLLLHDRRWRLGMWVSDCILHGADHLRARVGPAVPMIQHVHNVLMMRRMKLGLMRGLVVVMVRMRVIVLDSVKANDFLRSPQPCEACEEESFVESWQASHGRRALH